MLLRLIDPRIARALGLVRRQLGPAVVHRQGVHRKLLGGAVELQLEPLGQQTPQHDVEFLHVGGLLRLGLHVEKVGVHPTRSAHHLVGLHAIGHHDEQLQRHA